MTKDQKIAVVGVFFFPFFVGGMVWLVNYWDFRSLLFLGGVILGLFVFACCCFRILAGGLKKEWNLIKKWWKGAKVRRYVYFFFF